MTPNEYIGHSAFRVAVSEQWNPTGTLAWGQFMQCDGTELFYIRGQLSMPGPICKARDLEARDAFGTLNVCHACVGVFAFGQVVRPTERVPWTNTKRLEWKHMHSTTDRRGKRSTWGDLCQPCRIRFADDATEAYCKEITSLGFQTPIISAPIISALDINR